MEPFPWIPKQTQSLLDVGCNVGELLGEFKHRTPEARLAGIDINRSAVRVAQAKLPGADIRYGYGYQLPFEDEAFECVTCIEVIEHIPVQFRPLLLSEIRRVLLPGGQLVLRCPHAGIFDWLDAQNLRFRFPKLYRSLVRKGNRDAAYEEATEELVWHHHFTSRELIDLVGEGWDVTACEFGGLILFPICDILRWPFYRAKRWDHWISRALERIASAELSISFGSSSYGILLVLRKKALARRPNEMMNEAPVHLP